MKGKFEYCSPLTQLVLLAIIVLCCGLLSMFFSAIICMYTTQHISQGNNLRLMLFIQNSILFIGSPLIAQHYLWKTNLQTTFQLYKPSVYTLMIGCITILGAGPLIDLLTTWNQGIHLPTALRQLEQWMIEYEKDAEILTKQLLQVNSWGEVITTLIVTALLAGIGEELLFRGILQKLFIQWTKNIHIGIFIAAFIFSAIHMQFFGFIPRLVLGVILGYLYIGSRNLWVPIVAHSLNNAWVVLFTPNALTQDSAIINAISQAENNEWMVIGSIVIITCCLWGLWKDYCSFSN